MDTGSSDQGQDSNGGKLYRNQRQGVLFPLTDAIAWLVAARSFVSDVRELAAKGPDHPVVGADIDGTLNTFNDLAAFRMHVLQVKSAVSVLSFSTVT